MAQRLAQVTLLVRDYDEAIRFFTGALGFELLADTALGRDRRWVLVAPRGGGGSAFLLARAATPEQEGRVGDQTGGRVFLFLQTDDFWRDHAALRERGVRFVEEPRQEAYGTVAVFLDLYGNKWDLIEPRLTPATAGEANTPDAVTIRVAVSPDAPRLAELSGVLGYRVDAGLMAVRLQRLLASSRDVVLVAALPSGRVVGWLHGAEHEQLEAERRCEILGLVVDAAHRQLGVGRRLVKAIEGWAEARGLDQVAVRSNVIRSESHPFYERLGYQYVKTQHAYAKHLPGTERR